MYVEVNRGDREAKKRTKRPEGSESHDGFQFISKAPAEQDKCLVGTGALLARCAIPGPIQRAISFSSFGGEGSLDILRPELCRELCRKLFFELNPSPTDRLVSWKPIPKASKRPFPIRRLVAIAPPRHALCPIRESAPSGPLHWPELFHKLVALGARTSSTPARASPPRITPSEISLRQS